MADDAGVWWWITWPGRVVIEFRDRIAAGEYSHAAGMVKPYDDENEAMRSITQFCGSDLSHGLK
jgi:hypothetical protein